MTTLTRRADRLASFPEVCPKCGVDLFRIDRIESHFLTSHPGATGHATLKADVSFEATFSYIGPCWGESDRIHIVWHKWPVEIVRMRRADWYIEWAGSDPAEGET